MNVKIVVFVPVGYAGKIRQALGDAGAGKIGEYSYCSYSVRGKGRFIPSEKASPMIGAANKPEIVEEERVEVVCARSKARTVIRAMKEAHPYDEVAFDIYPLLNENEL